MSTILEMVCDEVARYFENELLPTQLINSTRIVVDAALRLKRGELTREEIHNLCHDLPHTVPVEQFAQGCIDKMKKLYGKCPLVADPPSTQEYVAKDIYNTALAKWNEVENRAAEKIKGLEKQIEEMLEQHSASDLPKYKQDALARSDERLHALAVACNKLSCLEIYLTRAVIHVLSDSNSKWYEESPTEIENMTIDCVDRLGMTETHALQFIARAFRYVEQLKA